jgi:hypothetical protein
MNLTMVGIAREPLEPLSDMLEDEHRDYRGNESQQGL